MVRKDLLNHLLLLGSKSFMMREITQSPDHYRRHHDDAAHLAQIFLSLFPCVACDGLGRGETVGWEFHHKWRVFALDDMAREDAAYEGCDSDADEVEREHDKRLLARCEKDGGNHDIDG